MGYSAAGVLKVTSRKLVVNSLLLSANQLLYLFSVFTTSKSCKEKNWS